MTGKPSVLAAEGYPLVMLTADMCRLLNIHPNTLRSRMKTGRDVPPWTRTGSGRRLRYEWYRPKVEVWLEQRTLGDRRTLGRTA